MMIYKNIRNGSLKNWKQIKKKNGATHSDLYIYISTYLCKKKGISTFFLRIYKNKNFII